MTDVAMTDVAMTDVAMTDVAMTDARFPLDACTARLSPCRMQEHATNSVSQGDDFPQASPLHAPLASAPLAPSDRAILEGHP